ncbi:MAG: ribosomal L7Ae/L30e/S12e/Gadd45 family protein [Acholeplasmataceae bacterium]|jgi:ribosomal protein L7Ae-like RNA K-turn-binding protein|nr:ribosomal L7Ae/L30e/S12e/Gadd45 family protein [Acholeplasmataceae bacterium]
MNNTLGLAYRARKVVVGTDLTISSLRMGKVQLILLATDTSHTTKKKIYDKAKHYQVDVIEELSSDDLSHALGKDDIKVIGITDRGFSQLLMSLRRK